MPTYEYRCTKCEHEFEKVQSMSDKALRICPKELCGMKKWGKGPVKRRISAGGGLIFKGSGFYITDYRSDKYKEAARNDAPATASAGDGKSGESKTAAPAKTESKPAKAESKPASKAAG